MGAINGNVVNLEESRSHSSLQVGGQAKVEIGGVSMSNGDVTVSEVRVHIPGMYPVITRGGAKKHPKDSPEHAIGHALSVSRALRAAAEVLEASAAERVREADMWREQMKREVAW